MSRVGRSVRAISSIRISGRSGLTNKRARREEARESGSAAAEGTGETRLRAGGNRIRTVGPFPAGPMVRILFPPAESPQTIGSAGDFTRLTHLIHQLVEGGQ